MRYVEATKGNV